MKQSITVFSCLFFLFNSLCSAQDIAGSTDHPIFNRISGFSIKEYTVEEFGSYTFTLDGETESIVEGTKTTIFPPLKFCSCSLNLVAPSIV